MAGVEANERLIDPLPAGGAVVHVLKFRNMKAQRISVGVDDARLTTSCGSELDIGHGPLTLEGNGLPVLLAHHEVREAKVVSSVLGAHRVEEVA